MGKQNFPESEKWFLLAIAAEPKYLQSYTDLFEIYKTQKRTEDAIALLKKGIDADTKSHTLNVYLARYYLDLGKKDDAKKQFEIALARAKINANQSIVDAIAAEMAEIK